MESGPVHLRAIVWSGVVAATLVVVPWAAASGFGLARGSIPLLIAFVGAGLLLWRRPPVSFGALASIATFVECLLLFTAIGVLGAVASYVVMATTTGYTDGLLDGWDRAIGFDWRATHAAIVSHGWLRLTLTFAYAACFWLPILLLVLMWRARNILRMYRFLLAHGIALVATIAMFALFPARAAFGFYLGKQGHAGALAAHYEPAIDGLRNGSLRLLDFGGLAGIVTFPSFHAAMAIVFAWAAWPVAGRMRWPIVAVNALMWLSAVPIGAHYLVDLIAGSVIATGAILATGWIARIRPAANVAAVTALPRA